jgi:hypothetical protein
MKDSVPPILKNMHKDVILLVEYLDGPGGNNNNNVWCSYAHAARYTGLLFAVNARLYSSLTA